MFSGNLFTNFSWASCEISIRFVCGCVDRRDFFVCGIAVQVLVEIRERGNKKKGGWGFFRGEEEEEEEEVKGLW